MIQIALQCPATFGSKTVVGMRTATFEGLAAFDIASIFKLAGMYAKVPVR